MKIKYHANKDCLSISLQKRERPRPMFPDIVRQSAFEMADDKIEKDLKVLLTYSPENIMLAKVYPRMMCYISHDWRDLGTPGTCE